ncbi:helicase [Pseudomonas aeruginosa]|uniref:DEAD/DEAH box helicase n=1 Tax=Pseudomonas aeruginosa TaxID=287 RepID=UPI000463CE39|nr:DEAD/DEAH box helicase family protein [Pseudomonas aeruginosa]MBG3966870.1 DEAD/DEAH box helicase family protein [Pseudomonas aeruginosa]MBG6935886.1 DEAD/DEAH box helicase family protein [Pseudomonas aeruginosa]MBG6947415.1 DEAD/DEAH box helicase family protein [Pseudomonas aeruginosa]MBG7069693.1 DEAD/DEAH box helicase family protein [Pseudomonas aeruginosa]MBG7349864.1 DEAD/DEAH box helicase family protein [Pseudomonas aeruginosa]
MNYFTDTVVNILGNSKLRSPQIEAYIKAQEHFANNPAEDALIVLPTGTGKSGLISIVPFGLAKGRVLIITPGLVTKQSIRKTQDALEDNFWINFDVIFSGDDLPVLCEYQKDTLLSSLASSHIVYSNIQQIHSERDTALTKRVPADFFDLIIVDEAHHAPASSWRHTLAHFSKAKKIFVTGTPFRGDNQELPGTLIHETPLSEVMRDRYVKWLRKETVNAHSLFFTLADHPGRQFSKEEVLKLKDREWIERSVALSEECSMDVIQQSLQNLRDLKKASPNVPHKILAVGCSIAHAEDLYKWYQSHGLRAAILHSDMDTAEVDAAFRVVENHECDVVISVNMLMEGYDHRYLTVLALFRPYRSINAFAQIVGRVLRAIPAEEITAFEIDNNAVVIYHQETGLDSMWSEFQKEVDRAKHQRTREYIITDDEYVRRDQSLAGVRSSSAFVSDQDSYLDDLDFNKIFSEKRAEIDLKASQVIQAMPNLEGYDAETLARLKSVLVEAETKRAAEIIDPNLVAKRPEIARKQLREILTKKAQDEVATLLSDLGIPEKSSTLYRKFAQILPMIQSNTPNDGILVSFINTKLAKKFGRVADRDTGSLTKSIEHVAVIMVELRGMLR